MKQRNTSVRQRSLFYVHSSSSLCQNCRFFCGVSYGIETTTHDKCIACVTCPRMTFFVVRFTSERVCPRDQIAFACPCFEFSQGCSLVNSTQDPLVFRARITPLRSRVQKTVPICREHHVPCRLIVTSYVELPCHFVACSLDLAP